MRGIQFVRIAGMVVAIFLAVAGLWLLFYFCGLANTTANSAVKTAEAAKTAAGEAKTAAEKTEGAISGVKADVKALGADWKKSADETKAELKAEMKKLITDAVKTPSAPVVTRPTAPVNPVPATLARATSAWPALIPVPDSTPVPPPPAPPATPAPTPKPATRAIVPIKALLEDLASENAGIAKDAALRLIRRPDAAQDLLELYNSSNGNLKLRALWCVRRLGEPGRLFLNRVLEKLNEYRPSIVDSVKEIVGSFEEEESAADAKAKAQAEAKKAAEDLLALEAKVKELNATIVKWNLAARNANLYHSRKSAELAKNLRAVADQQREEIVQLRKELGARAQTPPPLPVYCGRYYCR